MTERKKMSTSHLANDIVVLKALSSKPLKAEEIKFEKSRATLYRTLQRLESKSWIQRIEADRYTLTVLGRQVLEFLIK